jgi:hypothetical protein
MTIPRRLTLRDLNRATLARQMLLAPAKEPLDVAAAVGRLAGLQAQLPWPPYVGLWSRIAPFEQRDLAAAFTARTVVRATMMRGTLHVVTAGDYLAFRAALQAMLTKAFLGLPAERTKGIDGEALGADAAAFLKDGPRTFEEVRDHLAGRHPGLDVRAMGYAVRLHLPLVQVPGKGAWGFAKEPGFALAEAWLGEPIDRSTSPRELLLRYLAAFGPATARDAQTWSGLSGLGEVMEALRPELVVLEGEKGKELFDLPGAPRPPGDTPAPPRFLPDYDNLVLGHADRTRVVPDAYRPRIFLSALRVRATLLVDGFVRGAWKIERAKKAATLVVEPFAKLSKDEREAVAAEGDRLVRFVEEGAGSWGVRFEKV